jgi:HAD superfamily hydrolase (TIGR01509 family)
VAIRALVFDFDGLILDNETAEHQAWQEIYADYGTDLPTERWAEASGARAGTWNPYEQLERQLGELVDRSLLSARVTQRSAEILASRSTLPGVSDFIESARRRDMRLGLASNRPRKWIEIHLGRLGLITHFDAVRGSEDVAQVKPDPALHLSVCGALEVAPDASIAIEDSPDGIRAAKSAGLYCVSIPNALTGNLSMDMADRVLLSLATTTLDDVIARAGDPRRCAS